MKKKLREIANRLLHRSGLKIIRVYELIFLEDKLKSATEEIQLFFSEILFNELKVNKKQIPFLMNLYGTGISEAMYIFYYLQKSLSLSGDVCEFGVGNGATSILLAEEIKKTKKKLWLFDSFQGLSKPSKEDILIDDIFALRDIKKYEGTMSSSKEDVLAKLKNHISSRRIKIIEGFIEKTIHQKKMPQKVCFAYLDFDFYKPTILTLSFLEKHLINGGYIVVDDYGFFSSGVKTAVSEFMGKNGSNYELLLPKRFAGHFCILKKRYK